MSSTSRPLFVYLHSAGSNSDECVEQGWVEEVVGRRGGYLVCLETDLIAPEQSFTWGTFCFCFFLAEPIFYFPKINNFFFDQKTLDTFFSFPPSFLVASRLLDDCCDHFCSFPLHHRNIQRCVQLGVGEVVEAATCARWNFSWRCH